MKSEQTEREEADGDISKVITDEFSKYIVTNLDSLC
jgi:hypothetical protein